MNHYTIYKHQYRSLVLLSMLFYLCCFSQSIKAQVTDYDSTQVHSPKIWMMDLALDVTAPLGEFFEEVDYLGLGFSGQIYRQTKTDSPFFVGLAIDWSCLIRDQSGFDLPVGLDTVRATQVVWTNLVDLHLIGKYFTPVSLGRIEHYLNGGIGLRSVVVGHTNSYQNNDDETVSDLNYNSYNMGLSIMVGTGLNIRLLDDFYLDMNLTYVNGPVLQYPIYDRDIAGEMLIDRHKITASSTNSIQSSFGITWIF